MRNETRLSFDRYTSHLGVIYNQADVNKTFTIDPSIGQKLEEKSMEQADFLTKINTVMVDELVGETLSLGEEGFTAGRTNTQENDRFPKYLGNLTGRQYRCRTTNFDTAIRWETLDHWAKFPDFQSRLQNLALKARARSRLQIGFNGTHAAENTSPEEYPGLEDVNIGWLQHVRNDAPEQVLEAPKVGDAAGADYKSLDSLVSDAIGSNIESWLLGQEFVCIMGRGLLTQKEVLLYDLHAQTPTENAALDSIVTNMALANRRTQLVPFFPENAILITPKSNLSIYIQSGSQRRRIEEQPMRSRVVDWQSVNECYVVENYKSVVLIEGIQQPNDSGGWA